MLRMFQCTLQRVEVIVPSREGNHTLYSIFAPGNECSAGTVDFSAGEVFVSSAPACTATSVWGAATLMMLNSA